MPPKRHQVHDAADTDKENLTVTTEHCFIGVCFIPLDGSGQTFFGFSEFLAGLALMVLAWTIADVRYRFRIQVAPLPLLRMSFYVVAAIGLLTLLTDLWRAEQWLVPRGILLTPAVWQALLGGAFLLTILTWAWLGFIRPPTYGQYNAARFQQTLYRIILNGSPTELAVIADELVHSAEALVQHATNRYSLQNGERIECEEEEQEDLPQVNRDANALLLLIAEKRLCRAIVAESPRTAFALFQAIANTKKYGIPIRVFAQNIFHEALANKDSFLYHETNGCALGLIGDHKPFTQAMFANYEMVETIGTLFNHDRDARNKWDFVQWLAYCSVVLMTLRSYAKQGYRGYSFVLSQAMGYIASAASDLSTLNEPSSAADSDVLRRLALVIQFIKDAVRILDQEGVPEHVCICVRAGYDSSRAIFCDRIANMIFTVISLASEVRLPQLEWKIQHNSVWSNLFHYGAFKRPAGQVVAFKLRRLLYNQIADMQRFPNVERAKILRFCLNVLALAVIRGNDYKSDRRFHHRVLHRAVLAWTKKHFVWLHSHHPRLAESCLGNHITYDAEHLRLAYTHPAKGPIGKVSYFALNPASPPPEPVAASAVPNA
ncbi:hypothetical protein [Xylella fastidiosa]|uniref:Uncharacterized protein n=1 Tax=Xylella fastidiosa (strain 9a5c) TaxID=160492 RepID=Q9PAT1_XYLFA|nr:hypothetical protein [Xylella fastidiosa]AAF85213.1 hypothetical protein XF_2414 [Xylella fastidiosa 9a5c]ETE34620.1 hypothetical protein B398_03030 [Xylella fastidiosa 32]MDG5823795.1 hypothetical protein [Xylella fastidiosa subsp. pauca]MDG5824935.1 hypothetical protein [Xylella fastidiosa subsp. pauca]WGZ32577.1 hypothetical protein O4444_02875 [Xylella fastidiosa subsp. pauca]